jgi:hypothetical protein
MVMAELIAPMTDIGDVLIRRQHMKAELDRLKTLIAACDAEIAAALDAEDDEFTKWVMEVRGEVQDYEKRKFRWSDGKDNYIVYKRKGSEPRKTIVPEKLLAAGVPAHVIQAATTYGAPGKPGIAVRKLTGATDDSDED